VSIFQVSFFRILVLFYAAPMKARKSKSPQESAPMMTRPRPGSMPARKQKPAQEIKKSLTV
jgi:hypothetical protein